MTRIVLHIDRLALRGFAREDRTAIVDGMRTELARRFAEPGAAAGLPAWRERLRVPGVALGDGGGGAVGTRLGAGIASAVSAREGRR